ncbi:MAG: DNA repair protein RecN, partial [Flavobacteriaceae bacterium]|nr:DNA repair protein RecN [Flavobacteriaceae bacterium]
HDDFQFQVIDVLANVLDDVSKYKNFLDAFKRLNLELENLKAQKAESLKELDYNSFLLQELEAISLQ